MLTPEQAAALQRSHDKEQKQWVLREEELEAQIAALRSQLDTFEAQFKGENPQKIEAIVDGGTHGESVDAEASLQADADADTDGGQAEGKVSVRENTDAAIRAAWHVLVVVAGGVGRPIDISQHLKLHLSVVRSLLSNLVALGMVEITGGHYSASDAGNELVGRAHLDGAQDEVPDGFAVAFGSSSGLLNRPASGPMAQRLRSRSKAGSVSW